MRIKKLCKVVVPGVMLLGLIEVVLRLVWGFGNMPLYYASDKYEYLAQPNGGGKIR